MEKESLMYVAEDLEYLQTGWGPEVTEPDIRRGSAVLRRLLVEGVYGKAWRAIGFEHQPSVIAVDLDRIIGNDTDKVVCSMAWGAHFRGLYMATPLINEGEIPVGTATTPSRVNGFPGERNFQLTEFVDSTSGLAKGIRISRREVIKYIANVKGGVHLSQKAKSSEKDLIKKMEKFEKVMNVHTTDGLLVELVAIAQTIGLSEDATRTIQAINSI